MVNSPKFVPPLASLLSQNVSQRTQLCFNIINLNNREDLQMQPHLTTLLHVLAMYPNLSDHQRHQQ